MKNIQEQQTKERKSFKDVVMDNRGKIIAGVGIVGCIACCVMINKKYRHDIKALREDNQTLSAILSEGVLQDAITTTSNKINSRLSKLRILEEKIVNNDKKDIMDKINEIKGDLEILTKRKDLYETKLHIYEIKDLVD